MREANRVSPVVASARLPVLQISSGWFWQVARDSSSSNERPGAARGEQCRVMATRVLCSREKEETAARSGPVSAAVLRASGRVHSRAPQVRRTQLSCRRMFARNLELCRAVSATRLHAADDYDWQCKQRKRGGSPA